MKFRKYLIHSFILFVLLFSITTISAADLNDTTSMDGDVLKDSPVSDGTYTDFYQESSNVKTLNLERDYKFNNESDATYASGIPITKSNFVINGNNHIIDCDNKARAFNFTGKTVKINDLTIKNGFYEFGSAITTDSQLTLNNVTFINCSGTGSSNFGAIFSNNNGLYVNNCKFIDNSGEEGASITVYYGVLNVYNSTFISSSNKIIKGQIYAYQTKTNIEYSNFLNTTSKYATAIFSEGEGYLTVTNSKFKNLFANKTAGAIATKEVAIISISKCEFDNTSSVKNGGAIFIDTHGNNKNRISIVQIESSKFNNCYSEFGGALLQLGGILSISKSDFTSNSGEYDGGAIYTSYANVTISNSNFLSNTLFDNISYGGACYFDKGVVTLNNNKFENNKGNTVSTLCAYDTNLILKNNYFNNPSKATSIYTVYGKETINSKNNFNNDQYSFNNTNDFYNFENTANPFIILNNSLSFDEMPEKFDLRDYGWDSPVKNQGFMGSCWAFGSLSALESSLIRYANVTYSLSVNNMQNSMLRYSKYGETTAYEGGNSDNALVYLVDWLGIFPDEYDGYDELGKISSLFLTPDDIHLQNVVVIPERKNSLDNDLIKNALIKYGAVATTHKADFNESTFYNNETKAQYYYGKKSATHAVCIVGWDDNYSRYNFLKTPKGDGAWIVKNSWGTEWGDGGYFYVSYYDTSIGYTKNTAFIINNDTYNRVYQNDVGGGVGTYEDGKVFANIFTADEDELIAAVGAYFEKANKKYEIGILVNNVLVYYQTGKSNFSGYQTIPLNKFIQIKKGDVFRVMISGEISVITDARIHVKSGKSLVSEDGESWLDLTTRNYAAIIKAYTITDINITKSLVKYYTNETPFVAHVNPGEEVIFEIKNKVRTVKADENGLAILEVNYKPGSYNITTTYKNMSIVNYIKIKHTVVSSNVNRAYNSNYNYKLRIVDAAGKPIKNTKVSITVNGKTKKYTTNNQGYITLKFTKLTKKQTITVKHPKNNEVKTTKIQVYSRFGGEKNVVMYYFDGSQFKAKILGDNLKPVGKNKVVTLMFNKKIYKVKTNAKGIISFKIPKTAKPGKYIIMATYKGDAIKKIVKVKQNLKTSKYSVKKSAKKLVVKATLKNGKKAVKSKKLTLKLNGKTYAAKTNKNGIAKFTINKNAINKLTAGKKYTMKVSYLKNTVKTTLKVKN